MNKQEGQGTVFYDHRLFKTVSLIDSSRYPLLAEATVGGYHYEFIENHPDGDIDTTKVVTIDHCVDEKRVQVNIQYVGDPLDETEEPNRGFKLVYENGELAAVLFSLLDLAGSLPSDINATMPKVVDLYEHFYVTESDVRVGFFNDEQVMALFPEEAGVVMPARTYDLSAGSTSYITFEIDGKTGVNVWFEPLRDEIRVYFENMDQEVYMGRSFPRFVDWKYLKGRIRYDEIMEKTQEIGKLISSSGN